MKLHSLAKLVGQSILCDLPVKYENLDLLTPSENALSRPSEAAPVSNSAGLLRSQPRSRRFAQGPNAFSQCSVVFSTRGLDQDHPGD